MANSYIKALRSQKNIERLNGKFRLRGYNLLEHGYMVAVLFMMACKLEKIKIDPAWIEAILNHDVGEIITTDIPYDVKHLNEQTEKSWEYIEQKAIEKHNIELLPFVGDGMKKLMSERVYKLFKACDYLDLWIYCKEEIMMGNQSPDIKRVVDNCQQLMCGKFESIDELVNDFLS